LQGHQRICRLHLISFLVIENCIGKCSWWDHLVFWAQFVAWWEDSLLHDIKIVSGWQLYGFIV
jgi:hypothetical protein